MHWASGSLGVHSVGMQVSAHNVANVSTDSFSPQRAVYATGTAGAGVVLDTVYKVDSAAMQGLPRDYSAAAQAFSGTELSREMPQMIATQRGFEANAATVRTADQMLGTIIDMVA